jgi:hypothetical protein
MVEVEIKKEDFYLYFHLGLAFLLLLAFQNLGELFKFIVAPYIFYMVWSENPRYFPALMVNSAGGSTIAIFILISCFLLTLKYFKQITSMFNIWLLILSFLPAPILFYQTLYRFYVLDFNFVDSVIPLGFYVGIFPFFYGLRMSKKFSRKNLKVIFISLIFVYIFNLLNISSSLRITAISFALFAVIGGIFVLPFKTKIKLSYYYKIAGILAIVLVLSGFYEIKFHLLGSIILSFIIIILYMWKQKILLEFFVKKRIILLSLIIITYVITQTYNYSSNKFNVSDFSYTDITTYPQFIAYKAIGDRGVIWNAVWKKSMHARYWVPPLVVDDISFISLDRKKIEVTFGAHNLFLELLRQYGLIIGPIISIIYISMLIYLGRIFFKRIKNHYILFLAATIFGIGIVVGLTGMYTLMINFSFLFMGLTGILYGYVIWLDIRLSIMNWLNRNYKYNII